MTMHAAQLSDVIRDAIDAYAGSLVAAPFADYIAQHVIEWQLATAVDAPPAAPAETKDDIIRVLAGLRGGSATVRLTRNELIQVIADLKATVAVLQGRLR